MNNEEMPVCQSLGQDIAGKILLFFGALMQFVAASGYVASLVLGIFWLTGGNKINLFLMAVVFSLVLHLSGLVVIYSGDYIRGKTKAMTEKTLLWVCCLRIARDGFHVIAALLLVLGITALVSGLVAYSVVMAVMFTGCCAALWRVNKLLKAKSHLGESVIEK